ncbi:MAG TPA: DUF3857 domain-containing protein, partial [Puia sp.]|nr:DUF3857 domain-containing protein [Puia sp.]
MKTQFLSYGIVFVLSLQAAAQTYNVALIPDSLRKRALAVLREEEITLEIKSPEKAIEKIHHVITILNEDANDYSGYVSEYGKFISINWIDGKLYDAAGKEVKRVKTKDMQDESYVGDQLMGDMRYKAHDFVHRTYPYTVEYEEQRERNGILSFRPWQPMFYTGISTQHSKYVIIAPASYEVRYKPVNCTLEPAITVAGDKKIYTWEVSNLPALHLEPAGPGWQEIVPHVLIAPSDFEVAGYKGNMSSWENYGKFINQLRAGRDILPDDVKRKVHELTDGLTDKRQKAYALYDYLQKTTRYINVSLGIGGWQPFPAQYVATKRYGDCKALSNFMVALLKEAGIKANYVVIYGGEDVPELVDDFPSLQGNHIVTCVPLGKDSLWLECTDQTVPAGYMGAFTGERKAILIDDDGGHIVRTPRYSSADNTRCRVVQATIADDGALDADIRTRY